MYIYILGGVGGALLILILASIGILCQQKKQLAKLSDKVIDYKERIHGMSGTSSGRGAYGLDQAFHKNMAIPTKKKAPVAPPPSQPSLSKKTGNANDSMGPSAAYLKNADHI